MTVKTNPNGRRTKRRAFIHAYMINHQREHGRAPTVQKLATHFGCGKTTMYRTLVRMAERGSVRHDYGTVPAFSAIVTPPYRTKHAK